MLMPYRVLAKVPPEPKSNPKKATLCANCERPYWEPQSPVLSVYPEGHTCNAWHCPRCLVHVKGPNPKPVPESFFSSLRRYLGV